MRATIAAITGGYLPAAMAFGALATALHMPLLLAVLLSLLVYSGALQMAILGLWATGAPAPLVLLIGFLVNLRHMLYGPHLQEVHGDWPVRSRWWLAAFLTDEVYAVGISHSPLTPQRLGLVALWAYGTWQVGTLAGIAFARLLPQGWLLPLTFALPSLFLGLLLPRRKEGTALVAAGIAVALALLGRALAWPPGYAIVPILAGTSAGYGWSLRQRRVAP